MPEVRRRVVEVVEVDESPDEIRGSRYQILWNENFSPW